jgi:TRAP-type C4-dicarboxylate transport system permease small subunit
MKVLQKISEILGVIISVIIVALLMLMSVMMFAQVVGRYLFHNGIFWAEELSRFSMVTMVFFGAGLACKNKDHIRVTILDEFFKGNFRKLYRLVIACVSICFLVILAYYGFFVLPTVSGQISANMQVRMNFIYMMIPIGALIMILYLVIEIIEIVYSAAKGDKPE